MKLKLNKKKLKNLSINTKTTLVELPEQLTPQIAGGKQKENMTMECHTDFCSVGCTVA
jgi:hypothetical protein